MKTNLWLLSIRKSLVVGDLLQHWNELALWNFEPSTHYVTINYSPASKTHKGTPRPHDPIAVFEKSIFACSRFRLEASRATSPLLSHLHLLESRVVESIGQSLFVVAVRGRNISTLEPTAFGFQEIQEALPPRIAIVWTCGGLMRA